jgi:hypothetical protein
MVIMPEICTSEIDAVRRFLSSRRDETPASRSTGDIRTVGLSGSSGIARARFRSNQCAASSPTPSEEA